MQRVCSVRFVGVTNKVKNEANLSINQFRSIGHNTPCCYSDQVQLRCFIFELRPTRHDSVSFTSLSHETHYASVCSSWDDPCTCGLGCLIIFTSSWLITIIIPYLKMVASITIQFSLDNAQPTYLPSTYLLWDILTQKLCWKWVLDNQKSERCYLLVRERSFSTSKKIIRRIKSHRGACVSRQRSCLL